MRHDRNSSYPAFRYSRYEAPADETLTRIVSCLAIAVFFTGVVWFYGVTYHPDEVWIPSVGPASVEPQHVSSASRPLITPVAPAPDMQSPAIQYANADVPRQPSSAKQPGHSETAGQGTAEQVAPPKPKHHKTVNRLSPEAANAYGAAHYDSRPERYYSRPQIGTE